MDSTRIKMQDDYRRIVLKRRTSKDSIEIEKLSIRLELIVDKAVLMGYLDDLLEFAQEEALV